MERLNPKEMVLIPSPMNLFNTLVMRSLLLFIVVAMGFDEIRAKDDFIKNPLKDFVSLSEYPNKRKPTDKSRVIALPIILINDNNPTIFLTYSDFSEREGFIWVAYTPSKRGYQRVLYASGGNYLIQFPLYSHDQFYSTKTLPRYSGVGGLFVGNLGREIVYYQIYKGKASFQIVREIGNKNRSYIALWNYLFISKSKIPLNEKYKLLNVEDIKKTDETNWINLFPSAVSKASPTPQ